MIEGPPRVPRETMSGLALSDSSRLLFGVFPCNSQFMGNFGCFYTIN